MQRERRSCRTRQQFGPRTPDHRTPVITALESLQRLQDGNARFASNVRGLESFLTQERRAELAKQQEPFAIILGCSDSRVPAEIVFDQGLGDLFVIRVAGNIVAPSQVGSVEFAAARFGTRLVVVLGHSQCGAILATLEELQRPTENQSREPALDRRPRAPVGGGAARHARCKHDLDALVRPRGARQHPRVGGSPAPRLRVARAADRSATDCSWSARSTRSRRRRRVLRRSAVGRVGSGEWGVTANGLDTPKHPEAVNSPLPTPTLFTPAVFDFQVVDPSSTSTARRTCRRASRSACPRTCSVAAAAARRRR